MDSNIYEEIGTLCIHVDYTYCLFGSGSAKIRENWIPSQLYWEVLPNYGHCFDLFWRGALQLSQHIRLIIISCYLYSKCFIYSTHIYQIDAKPPILSQNLNNLAQDFKVWKIDDLVLSWSKTKQIQKPCCLNLV